MSSDSDDRLFATEALWRRAEGVLAAGTWTPSQGVLRHRGGAYPLLAERGDGCRLYDTNGACYVDWIMGWGPVVLGYRHPEVEAAIGAQLARGPLFSLLHPLEVEVAEAVRAAVPCAEGVAFGKNGSDVLAAAVRVARAHTGRELVLVHGYHGFHDWYLANIAECAGIPAALRPTVRAFPYNDLAALRAEFERDGARIACIVMEPTNVELPRPGYLAGVRELAHAHGALLVFDEIITGFRLARGGAQQLYGVVPDLACVGKALANGMPLSALCGRGEVLRSIARVGYGLTYRGETLSLAAARACLAVYERVDVPAHLARIGGALVDGFAAAAARHGLRARLCGPPARTSAVFESSGRLTGAGLKSLFVQECLKRSVLTNGNFLPSLAHDEGALGETLDACAAALAVVAQARDRDSFAGLLEIDALSIFHGDERELERTATAERGGDAC